MLQSRYESCLHMASPFDSLGGSVLALCVDRYPRPQHPPAEPREFNIYASHMLSKTQRASLRATFRRMKSSRVSGVSGVLIIRGKKPGKILGITACTHGNEPSGFTVFDYLLNKFDLPSRLEKGTVYLVVNNLKAAENYLARGKFGRANNYRYIDKNMNRLLENPGLWASDKRYEIRRARELLPVWKKFDVGFDIHSTSQDSPPILIGGKIPQKLVRDFPIETVLTNIDVVQIGLPAFGFYGNPKKNTVNVEIEAGGHENPASLKRAQTCAVLLLEELGMIAPSLKRPKKAALRREYQVRSSIVLPDLSYKLVREFKDGEYITKGTILATGSGAPIRMPYAGHTFMCPKGAKMKSTSEEALFLTEPVRRNLS